MNTKDTTRLMAKLAASDDSVAIDAFIKKFNRPPKTNNDDWIEVKKLLPSTGYMTADNDFELTIYRTKIAIVNYWKATRVKN